MGRLALLDVPEEYVTGSATALPERYELALHIPGRPLSGQHAHRRMPVYGKDGKLRYVVGKTPEAAAWEAKIAWLTRDAINRAPSTQPHPRHWPRRLSLSVWVISPKPDAANSPDLCNALKLFEDGLKLGLDVDDRHFEYDGIRYDVGPFGIRVVIRSAPLISCDAAAGVSEPFVEVPETRKPAHKARVSSREPSECQSDDSRPIRACHGRKSGKEVQTN